MNLSIEQFNPTVAELQSLVDSARAIPKIQGIEDTKTIELKKDKLKELVKARTTIQKAGKSMRDEANAFNKMVLNREKELLAIPAPLEEEFKAELAEIERLQELEARKDFLPGRRNEMQALGVEVTDEFLLSMDSGQYREFKDQKTQEKNEAEQKRLEAERAKLAEEREALELEKRIAREREEAAEAARKEAEAEAIRKAEKEAEDKRIQEEKEQKEAEEEAERMRKNKAYVEWVESLGEGDFKIERNGDTFTAYQKVAEITIE